MLGWPLKWGGGKITLQGTQATRPQSHSRGARQIVFWEGGWGGGGIMRGFRLALITDSRGRGIKGLARADNDVRKLLKSQITCAGFHCFRCQGFHWG